MSPKTKKIIKTIVLLLIGIPFVIFFSWVVSTNKKEFIFWVTPLIIFLVIWAIKILNKK